MKLIIRNILTFGSISYIGFLLLYYSSILNAPLFIIYIICFFVLSFIIIAQKGTKLLTMINERFPNISTYLNSIGWIPYVFCLLFVLINSTDDTKAKIQAIGAISIIRLHEYSYILILMSFLYATYKVMKNKIKK